MHERYDLAGETMEEIEEVVLIQLESDEEQMLEPEEATQDSFRG